ncbi:MAG TPA: M20/M25/M40 family metallo-hydrolase [Gemmatimonadaceae bacterium]|jgi:acetylornithine deacetylase/succinyl-diaminopimelate desuccinylase-like protein|nr:M20/M25/M40 family metallo-hydrolase [Gemmatimonadaceae bacterium]
MDSKFEKTLPSETSSINRREFLHGTMATAAALSVAPRLPNLISSPKDDVIAKIAGQHDRTVKMLQDWIAFPSIAAENRGFPQGAEYMAKLLREAGCQRADLVPTKGKPGVFATYDVGAPHSVGIYFMYDVKQFDPAEWSSPPLEGRLVDKPGLGKVVVGRGATNEKGPQVACLAALHAFKAANQKLPVNLVVVCEGEEEIGSPNFSQIVLEPKVEAALKKCLGVVIPFGNQSLDGSVEINLGAKGVVELELVSSGEKWGRGPKHDVHSSLEAQLDSPSWHLVQALNTLIQPDGHTPAVAGFFDKVRPLSARQRQILEAAIPQRNEALAKTSLGVERWFKDESFHDAEVRLVTQPTINIEGLVGGYTGPGGKTILPHRAIAKIDMRLVPDMTALGTLELLKQHLAKHGFGDIEVNMSGGYDPTETDPDSKLVKAQIAAYKAQGVEPLLWPRLAGSWPGVRFTGAPLSLPAGQFGMGHGDGAHAPDEYWLIESANPKVAGMDGAVRSYVELFYACAQA